MGEAKRRKHAGTYPDDEERRRFLNLPEVRAFAESPEGQRLLRPGLLRFMALAGITPQVDAATGELVVTAAELAKVFGISEAKAEEQAEALGGGKPIPVDRLKPLQ